VSEKLVLEIEKKARVFEQLFFSFLFTYARFAAYQVHFLIL